MLLYAVGIGAKADDLQFVYGASHLCRFQLLVGFNIIKSYVWHFQFASKESNADGHIDPKFVVFPTYPVVLGFKGSFLFADPSTRWIEIFTCRDFSGCSELREELFQWLYTRSSKVRRKQARSWKSGDFSNETTSDEQWRRMGPQEEDHWCP